MTGEELRGLSAALRRESAAVEKENAAARAETRRHFDVVTEGSTAEPPARTKRSSELPQAPGDDQVLSRGIDRRVRTLEEAVADLYASPKPVRTKERRCE